MVEPRSHPGPRKAPEAPRTLSQEPGRTERSAPLDPGRDGTLVRAGRDRWPPGKGRGGPDTKGRPEPTAVAIPDDTASVARGPGVVDLQVERRRRLVRDLDLGPTVASPCSGTCRCWGGVELGGAS